MSASGSTLDCCGLRLWCTPDGWVELPVGERPAVSLGGPYPPAWRDTRKTCDGDSGSGSGGDPGPPVVTDCGTVSTNLKVTYGSLEFVITNDVGTENWRGFAGPTFSCDGFSVWLQCVGGQWALSGEASYTIPNPGGPVTPSSTSPFLLMYSGPAINMSGNPACDTVDFTITEV